MIQPSAQLMCVTLRAPINIHKIIIIIIIILITMIITIKLTSLVAGFLAVLVCVCFEKCYILFLSFVASGCERLT